MFLEQAALLDGLFLDLPSLFQEDWSLLDVDVRRRDIAWARMDPMVVVMIDKPAGGSLERRTGSEFPLANLSAVVASAAFAADQISRTVRSSGHQYRSL